MTEPIFFEIPIYLRNLDAHTKEMKEKEDKIDRDIPKETYPQSNQAAHNNFDQGIWYAWCYNEIVGYLNLYILGTQFRADVWFIENKRINRGIIKKKFRYLGNDLQRHIPKNKSSEEIYSFILENLIELNTTEYKKYFFDINAFKVIGRFVNWKELTSKLNSYNYPEFRQAYFEGKF